MAAARRHTAPRGAQVGKDRLTTVAEHTQIRTGTTASRRPLAGIGRVLLWSGGSLWIGRDAGRGEIHAHHAIQIALAMESGFLMADGHSTWREHRGAIVMPHRPHRFDGCGQGIAMIFVEPETAQGRALLERYATAEPIWNTTRCRPLWPRCALRTQLVLTTKRWSRWPGTQSRPWPDTCPARAASIRASAARSPGCGLGSIHRYLWQMRPRSPISRPVASGTCSWHRPASPFAPICCGRESKRQWVPR